jgi:hypothetical protein
MTKLFKRHKVLILSRHKEKKSILLVLLFYLHFSDFWSSFYTKKIILSSISNTYQKHIKYARSTKYHLK